MDLVSRNRDNLGKMLNEYRHEGGFIGELRYHSQQLDQTSAKFEELQEKIERHTEDLQGKVETLDQESIANEKKLNKVERITKQLHEERTNNVGFADRRI